jgi:hypothetical protein
MPQVDKNRIFLNLFKGKSEVMDKIKKINEMSSEAKHAALGGVGIASQGPVGIGADLADAGLYAKEGDWGGAGLSILSLIPVLGMLSGLKKAQRIKKSQRIDSLDEMLGTDPSKLSAEINKAQKVKGTNKRISRKGRFGVSSDIDDVASADMGILDDETLDALDFLDEHFGL